MGGKHTYEKQSHCLKTWTIADEFPQYPPFRFSFVDSGFCCGNVRRGLACVAAQ